MITSPNRHEIKSADGPSKRRKLSKLKHHLVKSGTWPLKSALLSPRVDQNLSPATETKTCQWVISYGFPCDDPCFAKRSLLQVYSAPCTCSSPAGKCGKCWSSAGWTAPPTRSGFKTFQAHDTSKRCPGPMWKRRWKKYVCQCFDFRRENPWRSLEIVHLQRSQIRGEVTNHEKKRMDSVPVRRGDRKRIGTKWYKRSSIYRYLQISTDLRRQRAPKWKSTLIPTLQAVAPAAFVCTWDRYFTHCLHRNSPTLPPSFIFIPSDKRS